MELLLAQQRVPVETILMKPVVSKFIEWGLIHSIFTPSLCEQCNHLWFWRLGIKYAREELYIKGILHTLAHKCNLRVMLGCQTAAASRMEKRTSSCFLQNTTCEKSKWGENSCSRMLRCLLSDILRLYCVCSLSAEVCKALVWQHYFLLHINNLINTRYLSCILQLEAQRQQKSLLDVSHHGPEMEPMFLNF